MLRLYAAPLRKRMLRIAHEHDRLGAPRNRSQARGFFGIAHQAQVGLPLIHRFVNTMRMQIFEPDIGLRMGGQELSQQTAHVRQTDRIDRGDRQPGGRGFVKRANLPLQIVVPLNDDPRAFVKSLAFGRHNKRPLGSIDKLYSQMLFQMVHNLAGVGLRNAVCLGSAGKAAKIDDVAKRFEEAQVHIGS